MFDWVKNKIAEYAPDIVAAVATGGGSLAVTGLRILGKELLGDENATEAEIFKAAEKATPEQLANIAKANHKHVEAMAKIQSGEMANARAMHKDNNAMADKIADKITTYNVMYVMAMIIINCLVVKFLADDAALVAIASNVIGMTIKSLLDQIQSVTGFYFGSSIGSKAKDKK